MPAQIDPSYALANIHHLSEAIGGRGSCTPAEQKAAGFVADQLKNSGLQDITVEPFEGVPSTYRPYVLVFSLAFISTILVLSLGGIKIVLVAAAITNAAGFLGMLAESNLSPSWTHWVLPKARSQNVVAKIAPVEDARRKLILCAHLDTHRTPVFYSSSRWQKAFSLLVALALSSLAIVALAFAFAAAGVVWLRWIGILAAPIQLFALIMVLSADFTPFSPGANDNASGVGVVLSLASIIGKQPLRNTETIILFTGCEEVGSYGIRAYLKKHADELGANTVFVVPDEVGYDRLKYLSSDGLVIKHRTHPKALELTRAAHEAFPEIPAVEMVGLAYTDALPATKAGFIAITLCSAKNPGEEGTTHWHQMSDTIEYVNPATVANSIKFIQHIIMQVDQTPP